MPSSPRAPRAGSRRGAPKSCARENRYPIAPGCAPLRLCKALVARARKHHGGRQYAQLPPLSALLAARALRKATEGTAIEWVPRKIDTPNYRSTQPSRPRPPSVARALKHLRGRQTVQVSPLYAFLNARNARTGLGGPRPRKGAHENRHTKRPATRADGFEALPRAQDSLHASSFLLVERNVLLEASKGTLHGIHQGADGNRAHEKGVTENVYFAVAFATTPLTTTYK